MGWDRHKLLWDGTDKYVPWTTLEMPYLMLNVNFHKTFAKHLIKINCIVKSESQQKHLQIHFHIQENLQKNLNNGKPPLLLSILSGIDSGIHVAWKPLALWPASVRNTTSIFSLLELTIGRFLSPSRSPLGKTKNSFFIEFFLQVKHE